jgi:hypothetical protein
VVGDGAERLGLEVGIGVAADAQAASDSAKNISGATMSRLFISSLVLL